MLGGALANGVGDRFLGLCCEFEGDPIMVGEEDLGVFVEYQDVLG